MRKREERLEVIRRIVSEQMIGSQEELVNELEINGFSTTQATLSRDIKQLKIVKVHNGEGAYVYRLPEESRPGLAEPGLTRRELIEFSGHLAVMRTRPGYAMGIASDIDAHAPHEILATIAGDDTILIIPRDGVSQRKVLEALRPFIRQL